MSASGSAQIIGLIARRELRERLRAKSFYLLTGLLVVLIVGIGVVYRVAGDDDPSVTEVAMSGDVTEAVSEVLAEVAAAVGQEVEVTPYPTADEARTAVTDGDAGVALLTDEAQVVFAGGTDDQTLALLQQAWASVDTTRRLADAGLTPDQIEAAFGGEPLAVVTLDEGSELSGLAVLTGTLAAILLFVSLQTFGNYVLMGVVEEKASAVVEVLLVRVRADQLLAGKVIGIGVAALAQFTAAVLAGLVALVVSGVEVPTEIWSTVPIAVLWFLGGYALYSTLFALAGSLVSRQEDAQAAAAPITTVLMAAYFVVFVFGYVPDSTASRIMSVIPPLTPFLMPMRMAAGAASVIEVVAAVVFMAVAIVGAWKLSGRIYDRVLLHRGSRIGWKDALALSRG